MRDSETSTADRILEAAGQLLAEGGYEALSMRKLAAKIGLSQAAIYRHYADKDELVGRIVAKGYAELVAMVEGIAARGGSPEEILERNIAAYIDWAAARPVIFKALLLREIGPAGAGVEALAAGVARRRRTFALLAEILERGMAEGRFARADAELTAQALWTAMFGLASRVVLEGEVPPERRAALVARHTELLIRGLRP